MGARPRLTDGHLAQIAERINDAECERAYVSIESEQCVRETKRFHAQLAELEGEERDEDEDDDEDDDTGEDDSGEDEEADDEA